MEVLLTIAIPTIEQREECFNELYNELKKQSEPFGDLIEIIYIRDNKEMTIGAKRQKLMNMSKGKYIVQWDDDDWIHSNGIDIIMKALNSDADVISYNYSCNVPLTDYTSFTRNISINNKGFVDNENKILYTIPDCKNPIKRDIIKKVIFNDINFGEDFYFKLDLVPYLKTEYKVDEYIYEIMNRSDELFKLDIRHNLKRNKLI